MSEKPTGNSEQPKPVISDFINMLTKFQGIERKFSVPESDRAENDAEHSYNLAMTAWFIINKDDLPLDIDKVIKYSLVHDLIELYCGDSFATTPDAVLAKEVREKEARNFLASNALTAEFSETVEMYEELVDEEAKFVFSLDKIMPALTILQGKSSEWKDHGLRQSDWERMYRAKVEVSQHTRPYLEYVIEQQKQNPQLFAED